ncbi:MAG: hypothetical protein AB200_02900 [Parcubacteria bacterium C7867-005]|nr:MAG: hypothetical protein AB200_02900 [Parcubacteria bacterium C7867-005]
MKIWVKARTGAKEDKVLAPQPRLIPEEEEWYIVRTKALPVEGKANEAITKLLAEHFKVSRSQVRLIRGATSKQKVFDIKM